MFGNHANMKQVSFVIQYKANEKECSNFPTKLSLTEMVVCFIDNSASITDKATSKYF